MLLECFTLKKLKEILKYLQDSGCIEKQPKVYNINKYDTIVLLRNSGFCDENRPKELGVFNGGWHKYYKSDFKTLFLVLFFIGYPMTILSQLTTGPM